ncbi:MAG: aromatic amino acid lyase [Marmoricola sp.]
MGWAAARKLRRSIDGLTQVLAVEMLTAARALVLREPLQPAPAQIAIIEALRKQGWLGPGPDRWLSPEIDLAVEYVQSGQALTDAEAAPQPSTQLAHCRLSQARGAVANLNPIRHPGPPNCPSQRHPGSIGKMRGRWSIEHVQISARSNRDLTDIGI